MKYRCIIFDFDGTLADTEELSLQIYNELAKEYRYNPIDHEELQRIKHMTFKEILALTQIPMRKLPKVLKLAQHRMKKQIHQVSAFDPELKRRLSALKKDVELLGIITSNSRRNVSTFLKENAIDSFDFIVSSPLMSKELKILGITKKYGLKKSDILYVGDETRDMEACKAAGVDFAAVTWGYNHPETLKDGDPKYIIENMEELLDIAGK